MQMKFPVFAGLVALLLATPCYAETDSVATWNKKLAVHLKGKLLFPPAAEGQSRDATVTFVIDRSGKLISRVLVESTGSQQLDAAALAIIERADPFPAPPPEVKDDMLRFTVPMTFMKKPTLSWRGGEWPAEWAQEQAKVNSKIQGICRGCRVAMAAKRNGAPLSAPFLHSRRWHLPRRRFAYAAGALGVRLRELRWKNSAWLATAETIAGWNGFEIRNAGSGRSPVRKRSG
jgi:protein TonB